MSNIRVRFAPSPTGALHIGGVRTALYNYLFAKKHNGAFVIRIEDTDQNRYREGAEEYIFEALQWLGLEDDESPRAGGELGPYRQSDRKEIYQEYAQQLVDNGAAYYAFDTPEELEEMRQREMDRGVHTPKYDQNVRREMRNSLTMPNEEVDKLLEEEAPYVIRLRVPEGETITFKDEIRDVVRFDTYELDDKVLIKADGMPTYHMANIVDDHLMQISHVIRGEEWLSSTAHHVLLYRAFDWEADMPKFAHLPLILKPSGKGKLSKRDGQKLGIPVFPIDWESAEDHFIGFREAGFNAKAVINFLALLGWSPGTDQEIFSLEELTEAFSLEQIGKGGARFDYDKALWFNQQYIIEESEESLYPKVQKIIEDKGHQIDGERLSMFSELFRPRVHTYNEFWEQGYYVFEEIKAFDEKMIRKKWKGKGKEQFDEFISLVEGIGQFEADQIADTVKSYIKKHDLGFGQVLPLFRLALCGTMQGPDLFKTMELLGHEVCVERMKKAPETFDVIKERSE
jgi:glutamyl-tRNA synthetase